MHFDIALCIYSMSHPLVQPSCENMPQPKYNLLFEIQFGITFFSRNQISEPITKYHRIWKTYCSFTSEITETDKTRFLWRLIHRFHGIIFPCSYEHLSPDSVGTFWYFHEHILSNWDFKNGLVYQCLNLSTSTNVGIVTQSAKSSQLQMVIWNIRDLARKEFMWCSTTTKSSDVLLWNLLYIRTCRP